MKSMTARNYLALAAALAVVAAVLGCETGGKKQARKGDVTKIAIGTTALTVQEKIGEPDRRIRGRDARIFYEDWYYPTGMVCFYRLQVTHVILKKDMPPPPEEEESYISPGGIKWPKKKNP